MSFAPYKKIPARGFSYGVDGILPIIDNMNFIKSFFTTADVVSRANYVRSIVILILVIISWKIVTGFIVSFSILFNYPDIINILNFSGPVIYLIVFFSLMSLSYRRLKDLDRPWYYLLIFILYLLLSNIHSLIYFFGAISLGLIFFLCSKEKSSVILQTQVSPIVDMEGREKIENLTKKRRIILVLVWSISLIWLLVLPFIYMAASVLLLMFLGVEPQKNHGGPIIFVWVFPIVISLFTTAWYYRKQKPGKEESIAETTSEVTASI